MDTTLIPLPSGFLWDTGFDFSIRFSVEKAGFILAFVAQMMDGPAWKEDWFGAFGVKAVWLIFIGALPYDCLDYSEALLGVVFSWFAFLISYFFISLTSYDREAWCGGVA
jgi:hypothetical protein